MLIVLPPLPKELSPNARTHWAVRARAVKRTRADACVTTMAAMRECGEPGGWVSARVKLTFFCKRRADGDNRLASAKAIFDGMVDAGLLADDSGLTHLPVVQRIVKGQQWVEIEIIKET